MWLVPLLVVMGVLILLFIRFVVYTILLRQRISNFRESVEEQFYDLPKEALRLIFKDNAHRIKRMAITVIFSQWLTLEGEEHYEQTLKIVTYRVAKGILQGLLNSKYEEAHDSDRSRILEHSSRLAAIWCNWLRCDLLPEAVNCGLFQAKQEIGEMVRSK